MSPRGGRRKGAGRPLKGDTPMVKVSVSFPSELVKEIDLEAQKRGVKRSHIIVERCSS